MSLMAVPTGAQIHATVPIKV